MFGTYGSSPVHDTVNRLSAWFGTRHVCKGCSEGQSYASSWNVLFTLRDKKWTQMFCSVIQKAGDLHQCPWRLVWQGVGLCRIQKKLPPSRLHLTSSKALLTFKSWASWLVLKKKCQVIIDRNFCQGKTNTWNLYYPQGRAATEKRHLQNNSFLLLVYWSYHMLSQPPLPFSPHFFYKLLGQSCQGHCLITLELDQSCRSKEERRENLISHSAGD